MADGYDPKKSQVNDDKLAEFIRSQLTGDLTEVPGLGEKAIKALMSGEDGEKITNTHQLIGQFLLLKGPDAATRKVDCVEHCDKFWYYLKSRGINSHRSGIVNAIAEKVNTFLPDVYDADAFADEADK